MSKYIIFKADKGQLENWERMLLSHNSPVNTPLKPLPKIQVSPSLKIEA
ncbi:MAG: hypothetical protein ACLBM2_06625 [Dolichospermum sp.]|jgi:hypothetical protein